MSQKKLRLYYYFVNHQYFDNNFTRYVEFSDTKKHINCGYDHKEVGVRYAAKVNIKCFSIFYNFSNISVELVF
jgi:hypothetical protein